MTFRVNQRVVCVDAAPEPGRSWGTSERLVEGATYTVRAVIGCQILLDEIKRSDAAIRMHGPQIGYWARRFVPLIENQYSIECFTKLLQPSTRTKETTSA